MIKKDALTLACFHIANGDQCECPLYPCELYEKWEKLTDCSSGPCGKILCIETLIDHFKNQIDNKEHWEYVKEWLGIEADNE